MVVGETLGLDTELVNPLGLLVQLYVLPAVVVAPIVALPPLQIVAFEPALLVGTGFTVITTVLLALHPVAIIVSTKVYVVVIVGDTEGFDVVEVNPLGLLVQLYVLPATLSAPIVVEPPLQIVAFEPALLVGKGFTVMVTVLVALHPVAVIVSTNV